MDKNGLVFLLFVLFIVVFDHSDAFNSRRLVTISDPNQNSSSNANQDSSSFSPPPPGKRPDNSTVGAPKPKDASTEKGSENSSDVKLDAGKNQGKGSETFASGSCKRNPICNDQGKTLMACVQDFENGSNNLTLIVQNGQDVDLKVNITLGTSGNYLQTLELPAHATEKVNITFSGDKSNKVILNAGNGDCELQISQPSPVNSPSESKDPENKLNLNNIPNPADSPAKPKDVDNPLGTPAKPKDVNSTADTPAKPKDANNSTGHPTEPKDVDQPAKSENENDSSKSKDVNTPEKSKDVNTPPKSKEADDPTKSKSKDVDDPSKSTPISFNPPASRNNILDQLTFYSKQVTPIHGAYLAFLVVLVIGGSWALCSFRKRRAGGGVAYQELEMGPSESSPAVNVEIAEGWDQDWDDDNWDDDKAIRSPGGSNRPKTVSSNGLTSRATKKDCWDADWDD